jgi:hypothetical protein
VQTLILGLSRYSMERPNQENLKGAKLYTVTLSETNTDRQKGARPVEMDAAYELFDQVDPKLVPGFFELDIEPIVKSGKDSKPIASFRVKGLKHLGPLFPAAKPQ